MIYPLHAHSSRSLSCRVETDFETGSRYAADRLLDAIRRQPTLLLCVAAGSSPARAYRLLGEAAAAEPALFERLRVIQVDEWLGLPAADPATCAADLQRNLLHPLGIGGDRFVAFRSDAPDPAAECERVGGWLEANGPIDICVLGVGSNGHLAMNEPAATLRPGVHAARLAEVSRQHPLLAARPDKPTHGLTLGMADLLRARKILLMAFGKAKRPVLQRLLEPAIDPQFPASFLWLHPAVTIVCDKAAHSS